MNMPERGCVICGSPPKRILLEISRPDRFELSVGIREDGYRRIWVECSGCGAAANEHIPANLARLKELSSSYYEVDFKGSSIREKYDKVMSMLPGQSDNALRVRRIHRFMAAWLGGKAAAAMKVLDIGAGTGVFLSRFLSAAEGGSPWKGTAVEPDPHAAEHLGSLGLFEVVHDIYRGQESLRDFDLVTLNKIVEHVEDPVTLLNSTRTAMKADTGVLYVELPDKATIRHRPAGDNILGALHYHLHDIASTARLLEASGFDPLEIIKVVEPSGKISVAAFAITRESSDKLARRP